MKDLELKDKYPEACRFIVKVLELNKEVRLDFKIHSKHHVTFNRAGSNVNFQGRVNIRGVDLIEAMYLNSKLNARSLTDYVGQPLFSIVNAYLDNPYRFKIVNTEDYQGRHLGDLNMIKNVMKDTLTGEVFVFKRTWEMFRDTLTVELPSFFNENEVKVLFAILDLRKEIALQDELAKLEAKKVKFRQELSKKYLNKEG